MLATAACSCNRKRQFKSSVQQLGSAQIGAMHKTCMRHKHAVETSVPMAMCLHHRPRLSRLATYMARHKALNAPSRGYNNTTSWIHGLVGCARTTIRLNGHSTHGARPTRPYLPVTRRSVLLCRLCVCDRLALSRTIPFKAQVHAY